MSALKPIKGSAEGVKFKSYKNGQILFDLDNAGLYVDSEVDGELVRVTISKAPFIGPKAAWDALTDDQKMQYVGTRVIITDDYVQANYDFIGASASSPGQAGLVPAPAAGDHVKVLYGDGEWRVPPDTKYKTTIGTVGSASEGDDVPLDEITSWDPGTLPSLGTAIDADHITGWNAGTLPEATYDSANENVSISFGTLPAMTHEHNSIPNVTSIGTLPTLTHQSKTLPKIVLTPTNVVTAVEEDTE